MFTYELHFNFHLETSGFNPLNAELEKRGP